MNFKGHYYFIYKIAITRIYSSTNSFPNISGIAMPLVFMSPIHGYFHFSLYINQIPNLEFNLLSQI